MKKIYILLFTILSFQGFSQSLYFSEYAEGSSYNKYLEIYNPTSSTIDLSAYAYPSVSNAPTTAGEHEFWNTFDSGASIAPGDVYIIAHGSADDAIKALADEFHAYLSNGDDGYALVLGTEESFTVIDVIGQNITDTNYADPGSGWDVAGITNATVNKTLVRKASVTEGNTDWAGSAGTTAENSEWIVYDVDTWGYLGAAPGPATLSIDATEQFRFTLFPNPVSSNIVTISGIAGVKKAVLHDLMGRVVLETEIDNQLNVSGVNSGIYLLELTSGGKKATKKLIIQ